MEASGLEFPHWIAVRRRFAPHDPFFVTGNIERELLAKQVALELTENERYQIQRMEDAGRLVHCPIVSCGARLSSLEDFEDHYHARHMSACSICSRVYPTSRLLSIHVSEAHDSFFAAKVAHGFPMYECLVEGCGAKLKSYKSRQQHLIDKHKFPSSFEFKKAKPSKHQRQNKEHVAQMKEVWEDRKPFTVQQKKYQPKKNPQNEQESLCNRMEVEEIDKLVSSVSKLSTSDSTPSNISFGRRHSRAFTFIPRSLRQNVKHQSDAME
ncbi:hypothetical protein KFK09_017682 [Dendrobium nobile]|uniref:C2H2-type domain-containing protein n=1 Tax=Dendrobium nobile TaxID=94219 RepID=A0A8T3ATQ3_DENNO|nr:hypothetical protein KFK09_017682 [Dendrobium nobile]